MKKMITRRNFLKAAGVSAAALVHLLRPKRRWPRSPQRRLGTSDRRRGQCLCTRTGYSARRGARCRCSQSPYNTTIMYKIRLFPNDYLIYLPYHINIFAL